MEDVRTDSQFEMGMGEDGGAVRVLVERESRMSDMLGFLCEREASCERKWRPTPPTPVAVRKTDSKTVWI